MTPSRTSPPCSNPPDGGLSPKVSVIIPCYNHAAFLADAIASVRAQTVSEVEVIVVDDGSTDASREVAAEAGVSCLVQENRGLAAARNTGIRHSAADLLVFLDADDRLLPQALEIGSAHLEREPECAFVFGGHRLIDVEGRPVQEVRPRIPEDLYEALLRGNFIAMHAAAVFRRDRLLEIGGYDEGLGACEDYDLYLRLSRRFQAIGHDRIVSEYRRHRSNMSNQGMLMLGAALTVLARQEAHVAGDRRLERALRAGRRWWQWYYGREALVQAAALLARSDRRGGAMSRMLAVLRRAPLSALSLVVHGTWRLAPVSFRRKVRAALQGFGCSAR